jgi:GNAT superfamily N-acetyltransferase
MERQIGTALISDDKNLLQIDRICALLKTSYWAGERSRETIARSIEHSLCFGVYQNGDQVGFARCITDYATMYWLADVILDERVRGQGLGKALVDTILGHELLQGLVGTLATRDAQGLYQRFGFDPVDARYYRKRMPPKTEEA